MLFGLMKIYGHIKRSTGLARYKEGEGNADRKRDLKTTHQNGQDWVKPFERLRSERNGEKWLPDHP